MRGTERYGGHGTGLAERWRGAERFAHWLKDKEKLGVGSHAPAQAATRSRQG